MESPETPKKALNRRRALRSPIIVFKVKQEGAPEHLFGYAKDISCTGLFITSINPRTPGEQFAISFQIPDIQIKVRCRCEVVWMRKYDPKIKAEAGYGVRFLDIPEDVAQTIDAWVTQKK
jgi:hypothetical protein